MKFELSDIAKASLKSVAATVPGFAAWLQLWNEHESVELTRRVEGFWLAFANEANRLDSEFASIDASVQDLAEKVAIIERAADYAKRDPRSDRGDIYARIAVNSIVLSNSVDFDDVLDALATTDTLSRFDLQVLSKLYSPRKKTRDDPFYRPKSIKITFDNPDEEMLSKLIASVSKLCARGLAGEVGGFQNTFQKYGLGGNSWTRRWLNTSFQTLPAGDLLVKLTSDHEDALRHP